MQLKTTSHLQYKKFYQDLSKINILKLRNEHEEERKVAWSWHKEITECLHWCCKWSISSSPRCNISLCWRAADCRIPAPRISIRHRRICCKCSSGPICPNLRGWRRAGRPCPRTACVCTTAQQTSIFIMHLCKKKKKEYIGKNKNKKLGIVKNA